MLVEHEIKEALIDKEEWREYHWLMENGQERSVKIERPFKLFWHEGCTTHRVLTKDGTVYCVPTIGKMGCYMTWQPSDPDEPVQH